MGNQKMNDQWDTVLNYGPATFLNRPYIPCKTEAIQKMEAKAAILGFPYDGTTIVRTGSMMGPRRVRELSELYIPYSMEYDVDIVEKYGLVDCGDINVKLGNAYETIQRGKNRVLEILRAGAMPVLIGGEHTSPMIPALAFKEFTPKADYGFIIFDSHLDTAMDVGGDPWNHCCPVPRVLETGIFNPKNLVIIGPGGSMNPKAELEYVRSHGLTLFTNRDIYREGIEAITAKAVEIASKNTDGVYITFDMDVLEATYTPGTCAPTPGGMTTREMIQAIDILGQMNLIGFDVAEIAPPYDHSDITALTAARFIVDMLASRARYV
jgi:agmatinase